MKTITEKEYKIHTGCGGWFNLTHFTFDEVQTFLNKLNYNILILEGNAMVRDSIHEGGEISYFGSPYKKIVTDVFAIKSNLMETIVPKDFQSEEANKYKIMRVFQEEIKAKILSL